MLDAIKEAFHRHAGGCSSIAAAAPPDPVRAWRNDGLHFRHANSLHERIGIATLVCDDSLRGQIFDQFSRAPDIGDLFFRDDEPQGRPVASTARCSLALNSPRGRPSARGKNFPVLNLDFQEWLQTRFRQDEGFISDLIVY